MIKHLKTKITCREAERSFPLLSSADIGSGLAERAAVERHLKACAGCQREYRLFALGRNILDLAASPEAVLPDRSFFAALRARIERGPEVTASIGGDEAESWAAAMLTTAKQLFPAMAVLLIVIACATLFWEMAPQNDRLVALRPTERVVFNSMYDLPEPTRDDVLETLVAVEDR